MIPERIKEREEAMDGMSRSIQRLRTIAERDFPLAPL